MNRKLKSKFHVPRDVLDEMMGFELKLRVMNLATESYVHCAFSLKSFPERKSLCARLVCELRGIWRGDVDDY